MGVEVSERAGSRIGLRKGSVRITVHKPHPNPETGRAMARAIAKFLEDVGIVP